MDESAIAVVTAWHAAANTGDLDRLSALSAEEIELGGPRGTSRGVRSLRDWVGRAGVHLEIVRAYLRGETVVVEQEAVWRAPDTGEVTGRASVASAVRVRDGRVTSVVRYPSLDAALDAAGLTAEDAVPAS